MNKESMEAMLTLTTLISKARPDLPGLMIPRNVAKLQRLAHSLHKRYVRYVAMCNYQGANTDQYLKTTDTLEAKALSLAAELGVALELQRDPRGRPMIFTIDGREERLG